MALPAGRGGRSLDHAMIDVQETVASILAADTCEFAERDPGTFFASHIGFCPRQLYVNKLGLSPSDERRGQYRVARLIQEYLERRFSDSDEGLETGVSISIEEGPVRLIGRCSLYDPAEDVVYVLKVRNGWYQFSPPVERHLDQLNVYLRGLDASRGKLVYVSKNDIGDIRECPASGADPPAVGFDEARYDRLVAKATRIREEIWANGIATSEDEIPFAKCGCYFCSEEALAFPDVNGEDSASVTGGSTAGPTPAETEETGAADASEDDAETMPASPVAGGRSLSLHADGGQAFKTAGSSDGRELAPTGEHVPQDLRDLDVWVVWDGRSKVALAPWQEGTMYPCEWAASKDVDPRRPYEKARMVAELPVQAMHRSWPFPDGDNLPDCVFPAVLLPHEPREPPLTFVDFDAVRDPDTGAVTSEVADLVAALGGYAEVSRSGTGVHVYVRGGLPADRGMFTAPLSERGTLEIYDHSRFTGGTWRHVKGTPPDAVPDAEAVITDIVAQYGEHPHADPRSPP